MRAIRTYSTEVSKVLKVTGVGSNGTTIPTGLSYPNGRILTVSQLSATGVPMELHATATLALTGTIGGSRNVQVDGTTAGTALSHNWNGDEATVYKDQPFEQITITPTDMPVGHTWEVVLLLEG
ncbi:MAG: hypothetical protein GY928_17025 [Colwellia sp.]|nr:hypothetical protein [Colwellia sp.]